MKTTPYNASYSGAGDRQRNEIIDYNTAHKI